MDEIVDNKNDLIENSVDRIEKSSLQISELVEKTAEKVLNALATKGVLDGNINDLQSLRKFILELEDAIKKTGFYKDVNSMVRSYSEIAKANIELHKTINNINLKLSSINPFIDAFMQSYTTTLLNTGFNAQIVLPVSDILMKGIATASPVNKVMVTVKDYLFNPNTQTDRMQKYATQVTRDALHQFDGSMNQRIADQFGLDAYLYVGSIKPGTVKKKGKGKGKRKSDSRPQCIKWVGMGELLFEDLQKEIDWAYKNGSGMIPGTTPENFAIYRGGYNCRHQAIPTKSTKNNK